MPKILFKILYILIPIFIIVIFFADLLLYYSHLSIQVVSYFRELLIIGVIFISYQIIKTKLHFDELTIQQNLVWLAILIIANFLISLLVNNLLHPAYTDAFPPDYNSPNAILGSNIMAFTAAITFVPAIFILKQLIFYKRKRYTAIFFSLFLGAITINAFTVFMTEDPVGWFRFNPDTMFNDITMLLVLLFIVMLSFRNEWITYLPRKKKIIFFFAGIPLYVGIASLFDLAYRTPLPAYSLSIAALAYSMWLFLVIYGFIALFKLLVHIPTARAFDKKIGELNSLYDLGRKLNNETQLNKLLHLITETTTQNLQSNSTWLMLFDHEQSAFNIASHFNLSREEMSSFPMQKLDGLNHAIYQKKEAILINDVSHSRQYRGLLQWKYNARALLGAPFFSNRGQLMGMIYATKIKEYNFDIDDLSLIEGIANQAAIALENNNLLKESIERERLEQELRVAREVQLNLLPQSLPRIPNFEVNAFSLAAFEVGGDYYDFFQFSDGKPGIVIGDVSGKGTSAALYMAEFKGIIQTLGYNHNTPAALARAANLVIYPNIERHSFVSAIIVKLDPEEQVVSFARAGHPFPIYYPAKDGDPRHLHSTGIGMGLDAGRKFNELLNEEKIRLDKGDAIIFYTDGLTEARNNEGEEFGEHRLLSYLKECRVQSVEEIKDTLMETVVDFCGQTPLHDDLTFTVVKCCPDKNSKKGRTAN